MRYIVKIMMAATCSTVIGIAVSTSGSAQQQPTNSPSTTGATQEPSTQPGPGPAIGQKMMKQGMEHESTGQSMQGMGQGMKGGMGQGMKGDMGQGMKKDGQAMGEKERGHMGQGASPTGQSSPSAAPK